MAQAQSCDYGDDMSGTNRSVAAVIVAAGRGERAGTDGGPKQYRLIDGEPIIRHTLRRFVEHPAISLVVVAVHPDDVSLFQQAAGPYASRVKLVHGAATRQASTLEALRAVLPDAPAAVLIHDAVRPFASTDLIDRVIGELGAAGGCLPALAVVETLKRGVAGLVEATVPRDCLFAAQTPQGFIYHQILEAHERAAASDRHDFTDDASIAEWAGISVRLVEGEAQNIKLTYARDIEMASQHQGTFPDVRTGNGYDVHAFEPGSSVILCGVPLPHSKKLSGHSDADVALHALTDALLATCGAGDIGLHFPPSDAKWRGAESRIFVEHAVALVRARHGRIANADITLICEAPKIGPHREAMVRNLATMLAVAPDRVSVKATTNERLGFVGREEGIAAIATATVIYPGVVPA